MKDLAETDRVMLQVEAIEEAAVKVSKNITKLGRDIKSWGIWAHMKETVDAFKGTMPLIMDLRNPAMRDRHWASIMDTIGTDFDPLADTFTLDSMVQLRLDKHAEAIAELSTNASKELAIELSIQVESELLHLW